MSDIVFDLPPVVGAPVSPSKPPEEPLVLVEGFSVDFMKTAVRITLPDGESKLMAYQEAIPVFREYFIGRDDDGSKSKATLFPPGVYAMEESSTHLKLAMYYPEGKQKIQYRTSAPKLSVVPNIIVRVDLRKSGQDFEIANSKYFATSIPFPELPRAVTAIEGSSSKVTYLPFTNVYDDFRMCFGSNSMPRIFKNRDLRELFWYYNFLWNSPFNDDLGIRALRSNRDGYYSDHGLWYTHLAKLAEDNKPFPYAAIGIAP